MSVIRSLEIMPHPVRLDICVVVRLEGEDEKIVHQFDIWREGVEYVYVEDEVEQDAADIDGVVEMDKEDYTKLIDNAVMQLPIIDVTEILRICQQVSPFKLELW